IVGPGIVYVWPGERYEVRMLSHCSELAVAGDSDMAGNGVGVYIFDLERKEYVTKTEENP
ncbi:MAG: hypothetical protein RMI91_15265, partial [Gemmatales bacterium]|nr:hypothetical protein [Gemmatales bacterium]